MRTRHKARELALQVLCHIEVNGGSPESALKLVFESFADECLCGSEDDDISIDEFTSILVEGVCRNLSNIDAFIKNFSENWRLDRMAIVDRNILRICVFEMAYLDDIPSKVAIDEAVNLAKCFGSENSGRFVNGIADGVLCSLEKQRSADQLLNRE